MQGGPVLFKQYLSLFHVGQQGSLESVVSNSGLHWPFHFSFESRLPPCWCAEEPSYIVLPVGLKWEFDSKEGDDCHWLGDRGGAPPAVQKQAFFRTRHSHPPLPHP